MNVKIEDSWKKALGEEFEKDYFRTLVDFVKREYASSQVFPPGNEIFAAFDATPFDRVKVVILGQDPYHGEHQANGLCFSVNDGIPFPPSLLNIFKEIKADIGTEIPSSGNLERWARQGVLLLNATLTVRAHEAASHQGHGWETLRRRDCASRCHARASGFSALGRLCHQERRVYRPLAASCAHVAASVASVSPSRLLRKPSFFSSQRLLVTTR